MQYNDWLEEWNNWRKQEKQRKIKEIVLIIEKQWKDRKQEKEEEYSNTDFEQTAKILKENWYISSKGDLWKKISKLNEKWFSLDQIWIAISNFIKKINPENDILIHKQTISRIIKQFKNTVSKIINNK